MEFRKIVYFLKVAEKLNFTKAANELFISPQSLSRQIQELEGKLGYPLFIRSTTSVKLTEGGRNVQKRFQPLLENWSEAWEDSISEKKVKMAYFHLLPQDSITSKVIQYFFDSNKDWNLEMFGLELQETLDAVVSGKADFALAPIYDGQTIEGCRVLPLFSAPARLVISSHHPLAQKQEISEADFLNTQFIYIEHDVAENSFFGKIKSPRTLYANDNASAMQMVKLGQGALILPDFPELFASSDLVVLPIPEAYRTIFSICLIYRPNHPLKDAFFSASKAKIFL